MVKPFVAKTDPEFVPGNLQGRRGERTLRRCLLTHICPGILLSTRQHRINKCKKKLSINKTEAVQSVNVLSKSAELLGVE